MHKTGKEEKAHEEAYYNSALSNISIQGLHSPKPLRLFKYFYSWLMILKMTLFQA